MQRVMAGNCLLSEALRLGERENRVGSLLGDLLPLRLVVDPKFFKDFDPSTDSP